MTFVLALAHDGEGMQTEVPYCCYEHLKAEKRYIYCPDCGFYLGNKILDPRMEEVRECQNIDTLK